MRFGLSTITADRFFGKALRSRHAIHRQLADELANACPPIEHTQLILTITDAPIGEVTLDLDDEIGIINVGRDSSLSYAPKDNPSGNALDAFYAACWHAAIDAYPNFDAGGRSKLHAIVDDWQKGSANKSLQ